MCSPSSDSTPFSQAVQALCWWPLFWSSLAFELANNASEMTGLPTEPHRPSPLSLLHNDMLKRTPRPSGYVPPRKLWLRSV